MGFTRSFLRRFARHVPYKPPIFGKDQLIAVCCAATSRAFASPSILSSKIIPVVVFYPFVLVASIWGGTLAGLSSLATSAAIAVYLWLPPIGSFGLTGSPAVTLTAFSIVWLFGIFIARLYRTAARSRWAPRRTPSPTGGTPPPPRRIATPAVG
jgi:K+-sensing histidine kinase KdpD